MGDTAPPGLDLAKLRGYVDRELPGLVTGPLRADVVEGGRSNLTYVVTDGTSRWVVRRPPLGHVLPTAHDMAREHRVITALGPTSVPVPETLALCADPEVLGAPFYLMEFVPGTPYRSRAELEKLPPDRVRAIGQSVVDTLVELHAVRPESVGLADFGRPEGFLERQVRRWKKQLDASRSRELPGADALHERLAAAVPVSPEPAIVHGDYRLDNVLVADGRITAVLDWEMSTLGDPLADLGLMIVYSARETPEGLAVSDATGAEGYPSPDDVIARYAERSGRDVSNLNWYIAFGFFKLAVIAEGIFFRFSQGKTVGSGFEDAGKLVNLLIEQGTRKLKEE
jgi:aminoglycoside phosphotransferase (APT) family kinase protein